MTKEEFFELLMFPLFAIFVGLLVFFACGFPVVMTVFLLKLIMGV